MSTALELRPTWADVDLTAYSENLETIARMLPERARLIVVLKADGYGHGALKLAKCCTPDRVAMIATALLEESLALRDSGIELPLLVFGPLREGQIRLALDAGITPGVVGPEELAAACAVARDRDVAIQLKLDSGMGRMGVTERELSDAIAMVHAAPRLRIDAIYTHLANADDEHDPFTETQIANYDRMLAALRDAGIDAPLHHFANSSATLRRLVRPGDFARAGIALLGVGTGFSRSGRLKPAATLRPVLRWRTEIARLKTLPPGHAIGYGTTFHTSRESRIATLPVGYADGYNRLHSSSSGSSVPRGSSERLRSSEEPRNFTEVLVRGKRAPIVGRVSMDLVTIDVTDVDGAALGDEVVLLGAQGDEIITAEELASRTNTISYEVFCRISARVPRRYT
jgi:alanine racemase